ncbi:MAG: hypothetical protein PHT69_01810 [Bacteroidales bacterium]|nr:hypothetical protein [Bacteroidales bacterium]
MSSSKLTIAFTVVLLLFNFITANAQIDESKPFVYLQSGNIVYSNNIRVTQSLFKEQLVIDLKRYDMNEIKFINDGNGLYANTLGVYNRRRSVFAERTVKGPVNVFEMLEISVTNTPRGGSSTTRRNLYFINSSYNALTYMRPKYLEPLVLNNEQSMMHVNKGQKYYTKSIIYSSTALASFLTAIVSFAIGVASIDDSGYGLDFNPVPLVIIPIIGTGVGFGTAIAANLAMKKMDKELLKSIEVYNSAEVNN